MMRRMFLLASADAIAACFLTARNLRRSLRLGELILTKNTVYILDGKVVDKNTFLDSECEITEIEVKDGKVVKIVGVSKVRPA